MSRNCKGTVLILAACVILRVPPVHAEQWREMKAEHFIVYFNTDETYARSILDASETYYRRIAQDLGYPRYNEFWTWDKRVKIYIYPDRDSFLKATRQPSWSQGMADYKGKSIFAFTGNKEFIDAILPHEMAHLIFRDFVGFQGEVPLWLDEGVAQWAEESRRPFFKQYAKTLYRKDNLLALSDMMKLDIRTITDDFKVYARSSKTKSNKPGVVFLSGDNLISTYYAQSVSLVGFLIETYGSSAFADFCRQLRDGKKLEPALGSAYPAIESIDDLEERWRNSLESQ